MRKTQSQHFLPSLSQSWQLQQPWTQDAVPEIGHKQHPTFFAFPGLSGSTVWQSTVFRKEKTFPPRKNEELILRTQHRLNTSPATRKHQASLKCPSAHLGQGDLPPRTIHEGARRRKAPAPASTGQEIRRDEAMNCPTASAGRKDWVRCLSASIKAPTRALFSTCACRVRSLKKTGKARGSDLEADVRVLVHLGEKVRVRALLQQPALALEFGDHGLVRLVEQAQPVEPRDAGDRAGAQGGERDHELADHTWC